MATSVSRYGLGSSWTASSTARPSSAACGAGVVARSGSPPPSSGGNGRGGGAPGGRRRGAQRLAAAVVERQRLRTSRTGAQLVAPAVAQGTEQVAQLVAAAQEAGAREDGGVGVLDQVFGEVRIAAESTGGGVEPVKVSDRRFGVEGWGHGRGEQCRGGGRERIVPGLPHLP